MRLQIQIRLSFLLYLLSITLFSSLHRCLAVLLALLVHESGHYLVSKAIGEEINRVEFTPFGGIMSYAEGKTPCKGIRGFAVAAGGPAANYILLLIVSTRIARESFSPVIIRELIVANLSMIVMNTLPALPLDGGQMVFCIGYYLFPVSNLIAVLSLAGICVGIGWIVLAASVFIQSSALNCSMLMIGLYMILAAMRCKHTMLTENAYAVIQERESRKLSLSRVRFYHVSQDTALLSLLRCLDRPQSAAFIVADIHPRMILDDTQICQMILHSPGKTIGEAIQDTNSGIFKDKSRFSP